MEDVGMVGWVGRRESGLSVTVEAAGESGRLGQLAEELLREVSRVAAGPSAESPVPALRLPEPRSASDSETARPTAAATVSVSADRSTAGDASGAPSSAPVHPVTDQTRADQERTDEERTLAQTLHRYDLGTKTEDRWSRFPSKDGQPDVWLWTRRRLSLQRATGASLEESLQLVGAEETRGGLSASGSRASLSGRSGGQPSLQLDYNLSADGRTGHLSLRPSPPPALFLNGVRVSFPSPSTP